MHSVKPLSVALVGNPNCGKTTLFNELTKSHQRVGNWAGVTVAKKIGYYKQQHEKIKVIDLPGVYSLAVCDGASCALDERIACRFLLSKNADVVVNIVDASNLKRHLYLTLELLDMQVPCIIALNMTDVAQKKKLHINCEALAKRLGCPVIPMICSKRVGIKQLKTAIAQLDRSQINSNPCQYSADVQQAINELKDALGQQAEFANLATTNHHRLAIRLLEKDRLALDEVANTKVETITQKITQRLEKSAAEDSDIIIADCRYQSVMALVKESVTEPQQKKHALAERFDSVAMHPVWGVPFFLLIMYLVFEFSIGVGALLQPLFDDGTAALFVSGGTYLAQHLHSPAWLTALLTQGAGLGLNTVASFIPQIGLMFLALSFLEDSGYMARAAFVMDRLMQALGLPGKSFIPLIVGFGCNVPAVMATRTLDSRRDRILTSMMAPFMSCGARLAIFVVFGSTFFPQYAGLLIFVLYLLGIVVAMLTAWMLKVTVLRGNASPFILEVPRYHWPTLRNLSMHSWQRLKGFVWRAGKVILPVCILIGGLNSINLSGQLVTPGNSQSALSQVGRSITPVFKPMGVSQDNWPATVGLFTGALAKEVVIGTLNTLYSQTGEAATEVVTLADISQGLKDAVTDTFDGFKGIFSTQLINPFTANMADASMSKSAIGSMATAFGSQGAAFSYLLFVLLYVPCISTIAVIAREIGVGWAWFSTLWSTSAAYSAAVICYQALNWSVEPATASAWIGGLLIWQLLCFGGLKLYADKPTLVQA